MSLSEWVAAFEESQREARRVCAPLESDNESCSTSSSGRCTLVLHFRFDTRGRDVTLLESESVGRLEDSLPGYHWHLIGGEDVHTAGRQGHPVSEVGLSTFTLLAIPLSVWGPYTLGPEYSHLRTYVDNIFPRLL